MAYAIRYQPVTDLARRWPEPAGEWDNYSDAALVLKECANSDRMEIVEVEKSWTPEAPR